MKQTITTILCLLNTLLMVIGQTLFKLGNNEKQLDSVQNIIKVIFSPVILLAFPLVLIILSIQFHEQIPIHRWAGIALIFIGVYISVFQKYKTNIRLW